MCRILQSPSDARGILSIPLNDARGIAQMMRVGLYRPVHVETLRSQKLRMLLAAIDVPLAGAESIAALPTPTLTDSMIFLRADAVGIGVEFRAGARGPRSTPQERQ
jgi:hypothetical protein